MSKADFFKAAVIRSVLIVFIIYWTSGSSYSAVSLKTEALLLPGNSSSKFTSSEEFVLHTKNSGTCLTEQCHIEFTSRGGKIHEPVSSGKCAECHNAALYPNKFGLELNQRDSCSNCHKNMEQEIQMSKSIHGPIKNGDCSSCHDPHDSDQPFLLRQSYNELCMSCHKLASFNDKPFLHKPVKDGNCGLCHDPHASNFKARLIDVGFNLCLTCHEKMITGMTDNYVHEPILKSGCGACHDSHAGNNKLRLKSDSNELCFTCHKDKKIEIEHYAQKHEPAFKGQCISCHSPHFSNIKYLIKDRIDTLCYNCHKESRKWKERKFKHGPVVQGNCTACHNPHGSDNAFILRLPFPHKFYSEYERGKYSLCFLCHIEVLVTTEATETITNFRNGQKNLHKLHVKQKKGRTCRACHDVHASDQEGRIRVSVPFGNYEMELQYSKTNTGGSCIPGCHREMSYDRINSVNNEFLE